MKKKIIIVLSFIVILSVMAFGVIFMKTDEPDLKYTTDEIKFRDEYESLNGKNISDDYVLKSVNIDSDNNIKYVSDDEILDVLTSGNKVVYFGWADCNWCRTIIPLLLNVTKENKLKTVYYYNFKKLRDDYENNVSDLAVKTYEEIISIIGNDITTVFDENSARAGQKKILAPTVVFIKNDDYVGLHFKTVDSQENSSDDLTTEEQTQLRRTYQGYIDLINASVCQEEGC